MVETQEGDKTPAHYGDFLRAFSGITDKKLGEGIVIFENSAPTFGCSEHNNLRVAYYALLPIKTIKRHAKAINCHYDEKDNLIVRIYFKSKKVVTENCYYMYEYQLNAYVPDEECYIKIKNNPFGIILEKKRVRNERDKCR